MTRAKTTLVARARITPTKVLQTRAKTVVVPTKPLRCSPRKSGPAAMATAVKKLTNPKHCTRCPERPLRSQCLHTIVGQAYLARLASSGSLPEISLQVVPAEATGNRCKRCPNRPLLAECEHTSAGRVHIARANALMDVEEPTPAPPQAPVTPIRHLPLPLLHTPSSSAARPLSFEPSSDSTPSNTSLFLSPGSENTGDDSDDPSDDPFKLPVPAAHVTSSPTTTMTLVSEPGFPFGKMKFYQGREPAGIARRRPLPQEKAGPKEAGRYFRDKMATIFRKCEDVAAASKCYLFIGAYRPGSQNGAWTWASPRLRNDGGVALPVADTLANGFNDAVKSLLEAQRLDFSKIKAMVAQERADKDSLKAELEQQKEFNKELMGQISNFLQLFRTEGPSGSA